jgi:hypothetical protein
VIYENLLHFALFRPVYYGLSMQTPDGFVIFVPRSMGGTDLSLAVNAQSCQITYGRLLRADDSDCMSYGLFMQ